MSVISKFMYYFLLLLFLLFPELAFAQGYTLMAPLGSILSGSPDLSTYLRGAVTVIIGIAGLLAVSMTVFCGIRLMMAQSASGRSAAKECIWNAILGLLLAIGAWILLYTINPMLLSKDIDIANVAPAPPPGNSTVAPSLGIIYQWSSGTTCATIPGLTATNVLPSSCGGSAPSPDSACCRYQPKTGTTVMPPAGDVGTPPPAGDVGTPPVATPVAFSAANYTINEGAGLVVITVTRSSGVGAGSIDYFTTNAGAIAGVDYRETFGTLLFPEGVTTRTLSIPIIDNTLPENPENFTVSLSNPSGAIGLGAIGSVAVSITDNDPPTVLDTTFPVVTILSPASNLATTSPTIAVTFTASDNDYIKRLEYVYTPPSPVLASTHTICNTDCATSPVTMMVSVAMDTSIPGTHTITIRACDSRQCYSRAIALIVEASCVSNNYLNCKVLPTGLAPTPPWTPTLCSTYAQTTYDNDWDGTTGQSYTGTGWKGVSVYGTADVEGYCTEEYIDPGPPERVVASECVVAGTYASHKTDAYAFKLTSTDVSLANRTIAISGGSQNEFPAPVNRRGSCPNNPLCYRQCTSWSSDEDGSGSSCDHWQWVCPYVPPNVIFSISARPDDLSATSNTPYNVDRKVSGYCGNYDVFGGDGLPGDAEILVKISTTQSGAGICKVLPDRTYYLNITTISSVPYPDPSDSDTEYINFVSVGNALYSLFWNFLP